MLPPNHQCPYMCSDDFYKTVTNGKLSMVSINIRSLSGKINELANFLNNPYCDKLVDCMALQEIWNVPPGVEYHIDGFHPLLYRTRDSTGLSANAGGG